MKRRQRGTAPVPAPASAAVFPAPPPGYRVGMPSDGDIDAAARELGLDRQDVGRALRRWQINDSPLVVPHGGENVILCHETNQAKGTGAKKNSKDGSSNITFFYVRGVREGEYYLVAWGNHRSSIKYKVEGAVAGFEWLVGMEIHF